MAVRKVAFGDRKVSLRGIPRAEVLLKGPGGPNRFSQYRFYNVLVDTGATHTQLPEEICTNLGIVVPTATFQISTANGPASRSMLTVDLEVEGIAVSGIRAYVAPNVMPLLGRSALYALFRTTAFTSADWLWELWSGPRASGTGSAVFVPRLADYFDAPLLGHAGVWQESLRDFADSATNILQGGLDVHTAEAISAAMVDAENRRYDKDPLKGHIPQLKEEFDAVFSSLIRAVSTKSGSPYAERVIVVLLRGKSNAFFILENPHGLRA
jgi:gag-polyprotein putative aspartyl protease